MYSAVEKALFPLVSIPCMLLLYLLYRFGHAPPRHQFNGRMEPLYSFTASAIISKFLFQALPNATAPSGAQIGALVSGFIMLGLFIMITVQKCQRVSHLNPFYTSPEHSSFEIRSVIDHDKMEVQEYYQASDLDSPTIAADRLTLQDELSELRKRRHIFGLLLSIMSFISILEGFFLVYAESVVLGGGWAVFAFFTLSKLIDSAVIGVSLLHAYIHAKGERMWNWYRIAAVYWSILTGLSTMPVMVGMQWTDAFVVINHLATSIFYALAGGILLWLGLYFLSIDKFEYSIHE